MEASLVVLLKLARGIISKNKLGLMTLRPDSSAYICFACNSHIPAGRERAVWASWDDERAISWGLDDALTKARHECGGSAHLEEEARQLLWDIHGDDPFTWSEMASRTKTDVLNLLDRSILRAARSRASGSIIEAEEQVNELIRWYGEPRWFSLWSESIVGLRDMRDVLRQIEDELAGKAT